MSLRLGEPCFSDSDVGARSTIEAVAHDHPACGWQGVDADFDAAEVAVEEAEADLQAHLRDVRKQIGGGREICFVAVNKESHLIEVRDSRWRSCAVPNDQAGDTRRLDAPERVDC